MVFQKLWQSESALQYNNVSNIKIVYCFVHRNGRTIHNSNNKEKTVKKNHLFPQKCSFEYMERSDCRQQFQFC